MSYKTPSYYENTIKELNQRYYLVLDEIVKLFPKQKMYPKYLAYSKPFTNDMTNLNKLQTDFFLFKNSLESDIESLDKDIKLTNEEIDNLEHENKKLSATLESLKNSNNASHGMLEDTKLLYNQQLFGNTLLFLILLGAGYKYLK
jgi:chromosome segregation ATPase